MRVFPGRWLFCGLLLVGTAQAAPAFVDARDYPDPATGRERFLAAERMLVRGFNDVCGDTFCEGQYYNLWAMRLRCSVERATGLVASCVWTFAGSDTWVQKDGRIDVDHGSYACTLALAPATRLEELLQIWQVAGHEAIDAPLPGTSTSVYDSLTECL